MTSPEPSTAELVAALMSAADKWAIADLSVHPDEYDLRSLRSRFTDALEHLTQPAGGAPDGYVFVPREPTPDMMAAGRNANDKYATEIAPCSAFRAYDAYRAMLSAAPTPPSRQWSEAEVLRLAMIARRARHRRYGQVLEISSNEATLVEVECAAMRAALSAMGQGSGDEG